MINKIRHRGLNVLTDLNETLRSASYRSDGNDTAPLTTGYEVVRGQNTNPFLEQQPSDNHIQAVSNPNTIFSDAGAANNSEQWPSYNYCEAAPEQFGLKQTGNNGIQNGTTAKTPPVEEEFDEEGFSKSNRIGPWQAGWNVTNAIQGMFIVSLPYAVLHGGWWGVFSLVFVAYICYYTGLILVECLYDDEGRRVRTSYVEIAEACWGKTLGGRLVHIAQLIELLMTDILYVVLCGDLLAGCFPSAAMDRAGWMILSCSVLLSCAFITSLKMVYILSVGSSTQYLQWVGFAWVSWLSFYNTISHVVINAIILLYCLTRIGHWVWGKVRWSLNINTFPTVLGIVVFSYTSHIFLPTLEGNMEDKTKFKPMLKYSHIAAAVFKALMALLGFLTFGDYTQQEVTNNLPSQEFKTVINFILVIKALLSFPLPYYAASQLLEHAFFRGKPKTSFPSCFGSDGGLREWGLVLRVCLVLFTLFMAITIPHFALLMGLIGSFTGTMLSFIWPCAFHLQLKKHVLSKAILYWDASIIGMGIFFGTIGVIYSSAALLRAMNTLDDYY